MVIKKVCFVVTGNLHEILYHFTLKMHEAFLRAGIESRIITFKNFYSPEEMLSIQKEKPDLTISFNYIVPTKEGEYISDFLHIPHLSIYLDPSIYVMPLAKSPYAIISCVDIFECNNLQQSGFSNLFFLPHGVEKELQYSPREARSLDIVFIGLCFDYETLREFGQKKYPSFWHLIDEAIEITQSDKLKSFVQALEETWKLSKLNLTSIELLDFAFFVDNYVRGLDRVELLRAINDVQVHVYGGIKPGFYEPRKGWEYYLRGKNNVTVHPPVSYGKSIEILKQSKVCLNSMPFFKNGSHERIFNGLACGCLVVSTENIYIRENFAEDEGIVFYQQKEWDKVNDMLAPYLKDENKRVEAVTKGQHKVLQNHTWDNRVQTILKEVPPILDRIYEDNIDIHI